MNVLRLSDAMSFLLATRIFERRGPKQRETFVVINLSCQFVKLWNYLGDGSLEVAVQDYLYRVN